MISIKKISSYLFLLLFLQVLIPASLWHSLCDHDDSIDCHVYSEVTSVAEQHQHCLVLELSLPAIFHTENKYDLNPVAFNYSQFVFLK
ncbi:MAG: hypothetical protein IPO63_01810 [Bacteroidetes bacterium]|nr:hypothetical protein [Bacteroidota bacterium]